MSKYVKMSKESINEVVDSVSLINLAIALGDEMKRTGQQFFLDCPNPEHQETSRFEHFSLRPSKNICKCFTCGIFINSPLDYYVWRKHGKSLFSKNSDGKSVVNGPLFQESVFEIAKLFGKEIKDDNGNVMIKPNLDLQKERNAVAKVVVTDLPAQSDEICHAVYTAFLSLCPLRPEHLEELAKKRRYTVDEIKKHGFRSVPSRNEWIKIYEILASKGYPLERIPGFHQIFMPSTFKAAFPMHLGEKGNFKDAKGQTHDGHWFYTINASDGYFIPVRNDKGLITRLRVRREKVKPKYIWFSSSHTLGQELVVGNVRKNGSSSGGPLHIAVPSPILVNWNKEHVSEIMATNTVMITEGEHKANIVSNFFGIPVIGVPGAGAFESILPLIKEWNIKKLIISYDMDTLQKVDDSTEAAKKQGNLFNILKNFADTVKSYDVAACLWTWNMNDGKGLDDLIFQNKLPIEFNLRTSNQRAVSLDMVHDIM